MSKPTADPILKAPRKVLLKTIEELRSNVRGLQGTVEMYRNQVNEQTKKAESLANENKELDDRYDRRINEIKDLKTRLADAELENERLRGYVARVQEDDIVREELLKTGAADGQPGEQRLVPKRKHTTFTPPNHFGRPHSKVEPSMGFVERYERERAPPIHWVVYG